MEPTTAIQPAPPPIPASAPSAVAHRKPKHPLWQALEIVASLRLTVALFILSFLLVFFGTWAQVDSSIWDVVNKYFRSFGVVWIPLKVLTWYSLDPKNTLNNVCVPYPGGYLLGALLFCNLIAAHIVRFKLRWNRAGIIILHAGIMLMMIGEWYTGTFAIEGMMTIREGETVNWVQDNRSMELAVVDVTDPARKDDDIFAAYLPAIQKGRIADDKLPFTIEIKEFMKNSHIESRQPDEPIQATHGHGKKLTVTAKAVGNGVDPDQKIDDPATIVEIMTKDGKSLGTHTLSFIIGLVYGPDQVKIGDKTYEISLRPKRSYRDFTVKLDEGKEQMHPNTRMAKDYSSIVTLNDPTNGVVNRQIRIWMNNPLRYNGETFFQANMSSSDGGMVTGLQVVQNAGWLIPYLSCIIVSIGMLLHFITNLVGFLQKQAEG